VFKLTSKNIFLIWHSARLNDSNNSHRKVPIRHHPKRELATTTTTNCQFGVINIYAFLKREAVQTHTHTRGPTCTLTHTMNAMPNGRTRRRKEQQQKPQGRRQKTKITEKKTATTSRSHTHMIFIIRIRSIA